MKGFKVPVMDSMVNMVDSDHNSSVLNGQIVYTTDRQSWGQERRRRRNNLMIEELKIKQRSGGKCEPCCGNIREKVVIHFSCSFGVWNEGQG